MLEKESSPRSSLKNEEMHVFPDVVITIECSIDGNIGIMEFMEHGTNAMEIVVDIAIVAKTNHMQCLPPNVTYCCHRHKKK